MTPCPSTIVRRHFPRHDPFIIPAPPVPWPTARRPIWSTTLAVAMICILCGAAATIYQAMPKPDVAQVAVQ